jgi:hypothetical protein
VEWNGMCEAAFEEVKQMLATAARLAYYSQVAKLSLVVDTSAIHIGAVPPAAEGRDVQVVFFP